MHTVLIVDDCARLRHRLDEVLSGSGYFVLQAPNSQDALEQTRITHVDVLIAREELPDIEGSTLAEILRRRGHERLAIIILTESTATARRVLADGMVDAVMPRDLDVLPVATLVRGLLQPRPVLHPPHIPLPDTAPIALA